MYLGEYNSTRALCQAYSQKWTLNRFQTPEPDLCL